MYYVVILCGNITSISKLKSQVMSARENNKNLCSTLEYMVASRFQ